MSDIPPGTLLGARFRVAGVLGRGGMATVYLAEEVDTGAKVALKLLHPHLLGDAGARRRLEREVQAAARLDHPGVLVARELLDADGQLGLVLPLHPGHTLAEHVAMQGPLDPDQVRRVGLRLAEALGAAHRVGVLHRDVTARNVLVDDRGAPVLTDFGLARLSEQRTGRSTALLGTTGFVAPEVLAGQRADPRSDLYGLGAVLYQAATGREPFGGGHPSAVLQAQLAGQVAPIRDRVPDFPEWLDDLVLALLDPDPERRPQGAAALAVALEEGRAPEAPPAAAPVGPPLQATLPQGDWTVLVTLPDEKRGPRKARRAIQARARHHRQGHRHGDLADLVDSVSAVIDEVAGWSDGSTLEGRLAARVAQAAQLPPEALQPATALEADAFRLVSHVDQPTAERLADEARTLGLRARAWPERRPDGVWAHLLRSWWALIPLMWVLFPALVQLGAPAEILWGFIAATIALATVVGPWVAKREPPRQLDRLPVAYRDDLREHLAPGFRERAVEGVAAAAPGQQTGAAQTRAEGVVARTRDALRGLEQAVEATQDLPPIVVSDLRGSARDLAREVEELAQDVVRLEAELAAAAPDDQGAWAAERLARLETLARGGQEVDPHEQARLQAAVDAHRAALAAEQALESRLNADLARLLEIAATARRLRRELALEPDDARKPEAALDDLRERARAAAAARRELARG